MAGYGSTLKSQGEQAAENYLKGFVKNTKSLVSNGREATDAFVKNKIGDALVTFENEIIFTNDAIPEDYPYIVPATNIQADFPVTVIDKIADKRGTREVAEAFTKFLFSLKVKKFTLKQDIALLTRKHTKNTPVSTNQLPLSIKFLILGLDTCEQKAFCQWSAI